MAGPNIPNTPAMRASADRNLRNMFNNYLYDQGVSSGGFKKRNINEITAAIQKNPELLKQLERYGVKGPSQITSAARMLTEGDQGYALFQRNRSRKDAATQQKNLQTQQLNVADEFRRNLPQYVQQEAGALKKSLSAQLAEARGVIKANENARGMLYSGRRQKSEGEAANRAQAAYTQGVGDISSGAEKAAQSLAANPLKSAANLSEAQSQYSQGVQSARDRAAQSLMSNQSGYMGLIGQGVGRYLGDRGTKLTPGGGSSGTATNTGGSAYLTEY